MKKYNVYVLNAHGIRVACILLVGLITASMAPVKDFPAADNNTIGRSGQTGGNFFHLESIHIFCNKNDLESIYSTPSNNVYIPVKITRDSARWDSVRMRIRGDTSRDYTKKSLKLKFDDKHPYADGSTVLNLDGQELDPSCMRQAIATMVMIQAGYPCFNAQPVIVYINDSCMGFYLSVQNMDEKFLMQRNYSPHGNMYKAAKDSACLSIHENVNNLWEKKSNNDSSFDDLKKLISDFYTTRDEDYFQFAKKTFDYEKMVDIIALNLLIGNSSTYYHNYYMYHDPLSRKWTMFPWDMDYTFNLEDADRPYQSGNDSDSLDADMASNPFFERALACKPIFDDIVLRVKSFRTKIFTNENIFPAIESLRAQLEPFIGINHPNSELVKIPWSRSIDNLKAFIDARYAQLMQQFQNSPSNFRLSKAKTEKEKIILSWQKSVDPRGKKISYEIKYSTDKFFANEKTKLIQTTDTICELKDNLTAGLYYWKVIAVNDKYRIAGFDNRSFFVVKKFLESKN